jgi:glutaredoxin
MKTTKVEGSNKEHEVLLYAVSTCAWCKKAKKFLKDQNIEFQYVDVDLCNTEDRKEIYDDLARRGRRPSFPTIIVDDETVITGFHEDQLREALGI